MEKISGLEQKNEHPQNLDVKIESFLNLFANIDIHENQEDALERFYELYERNKDECKKILFQNINFKNSDNYFKTGLTLEFIKNLYILSSDSIYYSEDLFESAKEILEKTIKEKNGSYLLSIRAKDAYKAITRIETLDDIEHSEEEFTKKMEGKYGKNWQKKWKNDPENFEYIPTESEYDEVPFEITEGTYAFFDKNNLFIARPENFNAIANLIDEYKKIKKESMVSIISLSDEELMEIGESPEERESLNPFTFVENPKHPYARIEMQEILENIKKYCSTSLTVKDLSIKRLDKTPKEIEQGNQDLFDYTYLMQKPTRERIEEEFGLKMEYLSFQEQFYFLQLIKNKTVEEMEKVKDFTNQYGHNGLSAFMSLEFDRNFGDKILLLGEKLDPSIAREIFYKYSDIADSAQDAFKYFQDNFIQAGAPDKKIIDRVE